MENRKSNGTQLVKQHNQSDNKVKLCGYLKKKRNKVGGWRKMWFVLQDKLLLSYASKEEYDNKLVSFKDVLNLVPGTLVRPLGGFRFTIETTSHAMYTFHCDDRSAYREWITVLLDSLSGDRSRASTSNGLVQRFHNISADNIPYALCYSGGAPPQPGISSSCDSIRPHVTAHDNCHYCQPYERIGNFAPQVERAVPCVRLPIARSTAKILERNGVNSTDLPLTTKQIKQPLAANNNNNCCNRNAAGDALFRTAYVGLSQFRLHRWSSSNSSEEMDKTTTTTYVAVNELKQQCGETKHSVAMINRMFKPATKDSTYSAIETHPMALYGDRNECHQGGADDKQTLRLLQHAIDRQQLNSVNDSNAKHGAALDVVKDKLERISIQGKKTTKAIETLNVMEQQAYSKLSTKQRLEESIIEMPKCETEDERVADDVQLTEPIYAVVDLQHKYARRKLRKNSAELKRCNSYDSIMQSPAGGYAMTAPTYRQEKTMSSLTTDDIDGIYEDGDALVTCNGSTARANDDENIYEPINVPPSQPNAFWKCFRRLKVNSLLHLAGMRKRDSNTYDNIQVPTTTFLSANCPQASKTTANATAKSTSQFSSIKRKFGTHRKSMQVRVRKLCARAYEPKPFFKHHKPQPQHQQQQQQLTAQQCNGSMCSTAANNNCYNNNVKKSKNRWKSVKIRPKYLSVHSNVVDEGSKTEKQRFFGSLPHLRKPRASIFISKRVTVANDDNDNASTNST